MPAETTLGASIPRRINEQFPIWIEACDEVTPGVCQGQDGQRWGSVGLLELETTPPFLYFTSNLGCSITISRNDMNLVLPVSAVYVSCAPHSMDIGIGLSPQPAVLFSLPPAFPRVGTYRYAKTSVPGVV